MDIVSTQCMDYPLWSWENDYIYMGKIKKRKTTKRQVTMTIEQTRSPNSLHSAQVKGGLDIATLCDILPPLVNKLRNPQ